MAYVEVLILSVWDSEESMMEFVKKHSHLDQQKGSHGAIAITTRSYRLSTLLDGEVRDEIERPGS